MSEVETSLIYLSITNTDVNKTYSINEHNNNPSRPNLLGLNIGATYFFQYGGWSDT